MPTAPLTDEEIAELRRQHRVWADGEDIGGRLGKLASCRRARQRTWIRWSR